MPIDQRSAPTSPQDTVLANTAPAMAGDALARRRLLLKGLGKGSAAVAVLLPIQTLATPLPPDGTVRLCTVSGIQSNVGSGRTGGTTAQCQGYGPPRYAILANWAGYVASTNTATNTVGAVTFTQATPFSVVFSSPGSSVLPMIDLFTTSLVAPGDASAKVWATALLNALKPVNPAASYGQLGYFPYSPSEVIALYNDMAKRADAEYFFMNYLQTV